MSRAVLILLATWICVSAAGKAWRYMPDRVSGEAHARQVVREFLAGEGWQFSRGVPLTRAALYQADVFEKPGCPAPMAVVVLGSADEASASIRLKLGDDVGYIDAGSRQATHDPAAFLHRVWQVAGLGHDAPLPRLAVTPAPGQGPAPCRPPELAAWAGLGDEDVARSLLGAMRESWHERLVP